MIMVTLVWDINENGNPVNFQLLDMVNGALKLMYIEKHLINGTTKQFNINSIDDVCAMLYLFKENLTIIHQSDFKKYMVFFRKTDEKDAFVSILYAKDLNEAREHLMLKGDSNYEAIIDVDRVGHNRLEYIRNDFIKNTDTFDYSIFDQIYKYQCELYVVYLEYKDGSAISISKLRYGNSKEEVIAEFMKQFDNYSMEIFADATPNAIKLTNVNSLKYNYIYSNLNKVTVSLDYKDGTQTDDVEMNIVDNMYDFIKQILN